MKKLILLSALCISIFFAPNLASAQQSKFEIGLTGGPEWIQLRNSFNPSDRIFTVRPFAGISLQYNLNNNFSLLANIAYEDKGENDKLEFTDEMGNPIGTTTVHVNYYYITLPVLARYSVGNKCKFFVDAGPYVGYLLRVTAVTDASSFAPSTREVGTSLNHFELGITGGVGLRIPLSSHFALSFEVRDNLGLLNISPPSSAFTTKTNATPFIISLIYHGNNK